MKSNFDINRRTDQPSMDLTKYASPKELKEYLRLVQLLEGRRKAYLERTKFRHVKGTTENQKISEGVAALSPKALLKFPPDQCS